MMREITSASLMFLLAVAVSLRKSFANPIVSNGAVANSSNPTVHSTKGGTSADIEHLSVNGMTEGTLRYVSSPTVNGKKEDPSVDSTEGGASSDIENLSEIGMTEGTLRYVSSPTVNGTTEDPSVDSTRGGGASSDIEHLSVNGITEGTLRYVSSPTVNDTTEKTLVYISSPEVINMKNRAKLLGMVYEAPDMRGETQTNISCPSLNDIKRAAQTNISCPTVTISRASTNSSSPTINSMVNEAMSNISSSTIAGSIGGEQDYITGPSIINIAGGYNVNTSNPTIKDMIYGVVMLKTIISKHNKMFSSHFDETIQDLEREISTLPSEIAERRAEILSKLYNTQDNIKMVKSTLNQAADNLKSFCDELIQIYDSNDVSMRLLLYTAKKFVKYGNRVNEILKDALKIFVKINRELSDSKVVLKDFNAKLDERQEKINDMKKNQKELEDIISKLKSKQGNTKYYMNIYEILTTAAKSGICVLSTALSSQYEVPEYACKITNGIFDIADPLYKSSKVAIIENIQRKIDIQESLKIDIDKKDKLLIKIVNVQESSSALLSQVVDVKNYISEEIDMIDKWQNDLKRKFIMDHEDISIEEIEFSIEFIKGKLIELKNACTDYLNHKLPDILSGGAQSHITSPTVHGRTDREQSNIPGPSVNGLTGEAQTNTPHPTVNRRSGRDGTIISRYTANEPIPEIVEDPAWCQFINPVEACNDLMVAQKCKNTCNSEPIPEIVEDPAWCLFINPVEACNDLMVAQMCKNTCNSGKTSM